MRNRVPSQACTLLMLEVPGSIACISHAAADLLVLTVGLLDVLSSTTARASVARPCQDGISTASLRNLVRKAG